MTWQTDSLWRNRLTSSTMRVATLTFLLLLMAAPAATAATPSGIHVALLDANSPRSALHASGARISTTGKAVYRFGKIGLTIGDVAISGPRRGTFVLRDGFRISKGRRSVTFKGMFVLVSGRDVRISGKLGGRRITILTGRAPGEPVIDGGRIALSTSGARLSLTGVAERAIRKRISSYKPRSRFAGIFDASAFVVAPPVDPGPTVDPDDAKACSAPIGGAATDLPAPSGATSVSCGFFVWAPRSSWIDYLEINSAVTPAIALPPIAAADHYCPVPTTTKVDSFYYRLPVAAGWWDPSTSTGDIRLAGGIHFMFSAHGLDITVRDLDVRFQGGSSEIWATVSHSGAPGGERLKFATFNAGAPRLGGPLGPGVSLTRFDNLFTPRVASDIFLQYGDDPRGGCFDVGFNF